MVDFDEDHWKKQELVNHNWIESIVRAGFYGVDECIENYIFAMAYFVIGSNLMYLSDNGVVEERGCI